MSTADGQTVILVLGMHRSGTSALTKVINLLGAALSRELLPAAPDNERGFWESAAVQAANEEILAALGSAWHDFAPLPPDAATRPELAAPLHKMARVLAEDLPSSGLAVLKDPRLCRLAPLVLPLLAAQGRQVKAVLIHRHPWEVARSLEQRNGFPPDLSLLLWLRHVVDAERYSRGLVRALCGYEELIRDWAGLVSRLEGQLKLRWPVDLQAARPAVEEFLSPRLRHHHAGGSGAPLPTAPLSRLTAEVNRLLTGSSGNLDQALADSLERVGAELDQAAELCAPLVLTQTRLLEQARAVAHPQPDMQVEPEPAQESVPEPADPNHGQPWGMAQSLRQALTRLTGKR